MLRTQELRRLPSMVALSSIAIKGAEMKHWPDYSRRRLHRRAFDRRLRARTREVLVSSCAVSGNVGSCRISDWAEGWLATEQCVLGGRLFSGIMLDGLVYRHYPQPVAFGGPIDRNADARCVVGADRTRERGNGAGDEAAQKGSCSDILEPVANCAAHGIFPMHWVAGFKKKQRSTSTDPQIRPSVIDQKLLQSGARSSSIPAFPSFYFHRKTRARVFNRTSIRW